MSANRLARARGRRDKMVGYYFSFVVVLRNTNFVLQGFKERLGRIVIGSSIYLYKISNFYVNWPLIHIITATIPIIAKFTSENKTAVK